MLSDLVRSLILSNSQEKGVNHAVGVAFTTLANVTTVSKSGMQKHFPDMRVAPIVWACLREDFDFEVIVTTFKYFWDSEVLIERNANQILSEFLKGLIERIFVILAFSLAEADKTITVTAE